MLSPWFPAAIWLLIVTGLSVTPGVSLPKFDLLSADKIGHVAAYGILAGLLLWGFARSTGRRAGRKDILLIFMFSVFYGVLMEFIQGAFIPGRFYDYDDMIANAAGALLAVVSYKLFAGQN